MAESDNKTNMLEVEPKTEKKATTKKTTRKKKTDLPKAENLSGLAVKEKVEKEKIDLTEVQQATVMTTEYNVVVSETKTYILYTKKYNPDKLNFEKVDKLCPEIGSLCVVKEWKTYFGKPSKYVPVALFIRKIGGWDYIPEAQPVPGK